MMRWIMDASIKSRAAVLVIAAAVLFFGVRDFRETPVDTLPEFGPTRVQIQTEALGLSAPEVEQLITVPMEQDLLNGVARLKTIRSQSIPGLSSIDLTFEPGTDPFQARLAVQERVSQAKVALPGVSSPPQMLQPLSATNRVMIVGVSSENLSPIELSVLARWTIRPRLMGVPGVANVSIWGQRERQLQVLVDPKRLRDRGVTLPQIIETTANALWVSPLTFVEASSPGTSGFIDTPNQRLGIQHILPISSPADLGQINVEGAPLRLVDVADVTEDHQPLIGDAVLNENGPALMLVIEKFPEANTLDTTRGVDDAVDSLRPGLAGVQFDTTIFRPATSIERGLDALEITALIGLVIAVVILLLLLQWRTAVVAAVAVPLSVVAAAALLSLRGETVNVLVMAGLAAAVALIIDDVVTDTCYVMRLLRQRGTGNGERSIAAIVIDASMESRGTAMFAGLIVVAAALPAFFLEGRAGDFFPPLALSYLMAVATSMVVALTVTPALTAILVTLKPPRNEESPVHRWVERVYGRLLARCLGVPRPVALAGIGLVIAIGAVSIPMLNRPTLLPSFKEDQLLIHLDGPPGTSLGEMDRVTGAMATELRSLPGVHDVGGHVGRAIMSDQVVGTNSSELWVSLDRGAPYRSTVSAIRSAVDGYPGIAHSVVSYSDEKANGGGDASSQDLSVRIYGEDLGVLQSKATEVRDRISGIDGIAGARVDLPAQEPSVEIAVDLAAAQRYGIEPGSVRRAAATLLQGIEVGSLFEHQKVFQVIVRGTPQTRESLTSIRELLLETPAGGTVRLADVADVRVAANPSVIERDSVSRRLDVLANVSGRSRSAVRHDVEQALRDVKFPLEYHATVLEPTENNRWDRLLVFGVFAAVAILLLLQASLGSWRSAAVTFIALPVATVGGVVGALIGGGDITIGSYAGFLTLIALAARGAIALLNRYQHLAREREGPIGAELLVRGAQERVVPVLTTAVVASAGLATLAFRGDAFGYEVVRPMLAVLLCGLVSSTVFILFVMPVLSLFLEPMADTEDTRATAHGLAQAQTAPSTGGD